MRNVLFSVLTLIILAIPILTQAQTTTHRDAMSLRYLLVDYYSNHQPDGADFFADPSLYNAGASIGYARNINNFLNLHIPFHLRHSAIPQNDIPDFSGDKIILGLDVQGHLGDWDGNGWFKPYLLAGVGASYVSNSQEDNDFNIEIPLGAGLGFHLFRSYTWHPVLNIQTEYRLVNDAYRNNFLHSIGLNFPIGEKPIEIPEPVDSDGDGITDNMDRCPNEIGTAALRGCPDTDGDGIANIDDDCPEVAGTNDFKGCPDTDGDGIQDANDDCPTIAGALNFNGCPDSDGDGIQDSEDDCPQVKGTLAKKGCPETDRDNDGILDDKDNCPDVAGPNANNGCPYPDADGDGVFDKDDKCPKTVGPASNNGCPEIKAEDQETLNFAAQNIYFDTGKDRIKSSSYSILDQVADILRRYPNYNCSIGGHTDSVGNTATNQALSEKRAKACYDYLISKGISGARLSYAGYGESQPIADNKYASGREQNRRVVFNVYLGN